MKNQKIGSNRVTKKSGPTLDSELVNRVTALHAWGAERDRAAVSIDMSDLKSLMRAAGIND